MSDTLLLVAAPGLLGEQQPQKLDQVLRLPLLHSSENWAAWISSMPSTDAPLHRPQSRMEFTDSTHLLEAARLGMGVALTRRSIADNLLQRGELVQAFGHTCVHSSNYYALLPTATNVSAPTEQFLAWLQVACTRFTEFH